MRFPLTLPTEPRDSISLDKDSLLKNFYLDKDPAYEYIVKRPGEILKSSPTTTNRGLFFNPGESKLYYVTSSQTIVEIV